ncbi:MAG: hypothetical protein GXY59_09920 [Bacteroidales bacterium]|nr:hypothetical protein [Bacteroidales bacterium]
MKTFLTLVLFVTLVPVRAQKISGKIEGHNKGEMDIVLTMFGFDKLVKIGTISASGDFEINLSANPIGMLTDEEREFYIDKLAYGFQYGCGNPDDFPEGEPKIARDAGYIALWANNEWSGTLFPVSDEKLQPWMEDNGYNDAVQASFYKVLLVTEDVEVQKKCINFDFYNDKDIEVGVEYDLRLKEGLNLVQYQFKSIYKTDPDIRASFPTKIKMTDAGENPEIIWMAKYFY